MTPQEIFDHIAGRLEKQTERSSILVKESILWKNMCVYRTDTGNMCAVGHILSETGVSETTLKHMYNTKAPVRSLYFQFKKHLPDWFRDNLPLLSSLQTVHDSVSNWWEDKVNMRNHLAKVAKGYNLNFDAENWNKQ